MSDKIITLHKARLAREKGVIRKDWGGRLSIALTYPNHYRLGMSNLGLQIVYHLLNRRGNVVAERVFLPDREENTLYLETGLVEGKDLVGHELGSRVYLFYKTIYEF